MPDPFLGLPKPRLLWSEEGVPHNLDHEDGYFSDVDGLRETSNVFLNGCYLPHAWQDKITFTIGELGFGTGLNFLSTWALWRRTHAPDAHLHYISVEGMPFNLTDLRRALNTFPSLSEMAEKLLAAWPPAIKGVHRLHFDDENITLTLYFMDVARALPQMEMPADCWFLDGFAPSRNADMWSKTVFTQIARLSHKGARIATFSVAGRVRRGLQGAGFSVSKRPGHGRKRERLEAIFQGQDHPVSRKQTRPLARCVPGTKSIVVIGGGIAGACTAHAFLRRGLEVTIISKDGLADEASGNPAALVSPRLDRDDTPMARFFRTTFHYATRFYAGLGSNIWNHCGVLRFPVHASDAQKFDRLIKAHALPEDILQPASGHVAMFLPSAGVVNPAAAITAMTTGATKITARIGTIEQQNDKWVALDGKKKPVARAPLLVLALGSGTLDQLAWLKFQYLKGQISKAKLSTSYLGPALLGDGYAIALPDQSLLMGATFEETDPAQTDLSPDPQVHKHNIAAVSRLNPALGKTIQTDKTKGRVSIRATTPDQMPYVGPMIKEDDFLNRFHALKHGFIDPKAGNAQRIENLHVCMGLGSRGFALAPLLGEAIAAEALGEPPALEKEVSEALHPARVLERRLKSGNV